MSNSHDASASAVGYLHQVAWGLLELLRFGKDRPDQGILLEKWDDVSWDDEGTPTELLQLKSHKPGTKPLTDKSDDWWRTVQVWMDDARFLAAHGPRLALVTTSLAPQGSAASFLRPDSDRDSTRALKLLNHAAQSSNNAETKASRDAWLALTDSTRHDLLERVEVLDESTGDVLAEIRRELFLIPPRDAARKKDLEQALLGWWHAVALDMLRGSRGSINAMQLATEIDRLSRRFGGDALYTTVDEVDQDAWSGIVADHGDRLFVRQMDLIGLNNRLVEMSIINFYRQVEQTTDWLDRDLIEMREFDSFKNSLATEWEWRFHAMCDELPRDATEETKKAKGRELFHALRTLASMKIRSDYADTFYGHGVQMEIADEGHHGWHQDFNALLESVTVGRE
ncbi:ABC-three component system protein [Frondihabitans australicus]|uniref:ABC-three component systems C-terminal domain-containing protein n=1 Tax=Frondihabitans australicus TaxID=386892 RepID=A0A495IK06_9MICO|nr:ABC-three component system protein [Frondihabitans australicus]RKR76297.1 hypothetical protein C8E83_3465 [Frondihabitans australicus]